MVDKFAFEAWCKDPKLQQESAGERATDCSRKLLAETSGDGAHHTNSSKPADNMPKSFIGTAHADKSGTLILHLHSEVGSTLVESTLLYRKGDPNYQNILKHLGGKFKPHEVRSVRPWEPDER